MKLKVIVHPAEEGGLWAEVPAIPGCATQGETWEELMENLRESAEGCLQAVAPSQQPRPAGLCVGEFVVPDDLDAPLPDEILDAFEFDLQFHGVSHCQRKL